MNHASLRNASEISIESCHPNENARVGLRLQEQKQSRRNGHSPRDKDNKAKRSKDQVPRFTSFICVVCEQLAERVFSHSFMLILSPHSVL